MSKYWKEFRLIIKIKNNTLFIFPRGKVKFPFWRGNRIIVPYLRFLGLSKPGLQSEFLHQAVQPNTVCLFVIPLSYLAGKCV